MIRLSVDLAGVVLTTTLALSLTACKTPASIPADKTRTSAPLDPATLGNLTGTIRLEGKVPAPLKIDTTMDPACGLSGGNPMAEQYVVHDGKLANAYLYIKSGPAAAMNATPTSNTPVVLDQKGCLYTPHVIAVMAGGSVEFRNSDPTMHNIHTMPTTAGNEPIDISVSPKGTPKAKQFTQPEAMIPVRCNNHPWMNAFINVSPTPFFAISDSAGHFDIKGLPAGTYTLGAIHEKLGEQTLQITVQPRSTTQANLVFTAH